MKLSFLSFIWKYTKAFFNTAIPSFFNKAGTNSQSHSKPVNAEKGNISQDDEFASNVVNLKSSYGTPHMDMPSVQYTQNPFSVNQQENDFLRQSVLGDEAPFKKSSKMKSIKTQDLGKIRSWAIKAAAVAGACFSFAAIQSLTPLNEDTSASPEADQQSYETTAETAELDTNYIFPFENFDQGSNPMQASDFTMVTDVEDTNNNDLTENENDTITSGPIATITDDKAYAHVISGPNHSIASVKTDINNGLVTVSFNANIEDENMDKAESTVIPRQKPVESVATQTTEKTISKLDPNSTTAFYLNDKTKFDCMADVFDAEDQNIPYIPTGECDTDEIHQYAAQISGSQDVTHYAAHYIDGLDTIADVEAYTVKKALPAQIATAPEILTSNDDTPVNTMAYKDISTIPMARPAPVFKAVSTPCPPNRPRSFVYGSMANGPLLSF